MRPIEDRDSHSYAQPEKDEPHEQKFRRLNQRYAELLQYCENLEERIAEIESIILPRKVK